MNVNTRTDAIHLHRLLRVFDVESLGEGDMVAGTNVLAAMCASIANLPPPGACLITPGGDRLPVGMSFATVGGLTDSLVSEKVLDPIANVQNNFGDHLAADTAYIAANLAALPEHERIRIRPAKPTGAPELANLKVDVKGLMTATDSSPFMRLLAPCRYDGTGELVSHPAVFLDAGSPVDLEKQLLRAHRRHPFVRAVLSDGSGSECVQNILLSVVRGTSLTVGLADSIHIRGHVAASCTIAKLAQSVDAGEGCLLGNLLWLVDGDGCPMSLEARASDGPASYQTPRNYPELLRRAWAERLDYRRIEAPCIRYDWVMRQREWVALLQKLEPRCPGLIRATRPLFATLTYGLLKLSVGEQGESPRWVDTDVLDLAKLLVGRMVQYRERLAQNERDIRVLELAIKVIHKLEAAPLDARGIVRKTSRLAINDCREALGLLGRLGVARCVGDGKWGLVLPVTQAVKKIRTSSIDV